MSTTSYCVNSIVIYFAITIVVKTVAILDTRFHGANTDLLAINALLRTQVARINAGGTAKGSNVGKVVVNNAVAIVVETIANLSDFAG
jgi:hypothetical protein